MLCCIEQEIEMDNLKQADELSNMEESWRNRCWRTPSAMLGKSPLFNSFKGMCSQRILLLWQPTNLPLNGKMTQCVSSNHWRRFREFSEQWTVCVMYLTFQQSSKLWLLLAFKVQQHEVYVCWGSKERVSCHFCPTGVYNGIATVL